MDNYEIKYKKLYNQITDLIDGAADDINIYKREALEFNIFVTKKVDYLTKIKGYDIINSFEFIITNFNILIQDFRMDKVRQKKQKRF